MQHGETDKVKGEHDPSVELDDVHSFYICNIQLVCVLLTVGITHLHLLTIVLHCRLVATGKTVENCCC